MTTFMLAANNPYKAPNKHKDPAVTDKADQNDC